MTKKEIDEINKIANSKHGGDLRAAALDFLGLDAAATDGHDPHAAAVNGIVDEVAQYNEASAETRKAIDEYKAAKDPKKAANAGTTKAKSK